jgi:hypothetical protein
VRLDQTRTTVPDVAEKSLPLLNGQRHEVLGDLIVQRSTRAFARACA